MTLTRSWTDVDVDLGVRPAPVAGRERPVDIAVRGDRIAGIAASIPDPAVRQCQEISDRIM